MNSQYNSPKRIFALNLLQQNKSNVEINEILKEKFGSGMSARDLKDLRSVVLKFPSNEQWKKIFIEMFDIFAVIYQKSNNQEISIIVRKFADLRYNLMKHEYVANLKDPALVSHKGIIALLNGFDEVKDAMLKKALPN